MKIKRNIGMLDTVLRIGIGLVMVYFGFTDNQVVTDEFSKVLLSLMGSLMILIAIIGHCPLYATIGFDTCNCSLDSPDSN